jgi:hypothetical protein
VPSSASSVCWWRLQRGSAPEVARYERDSFQRSFGPFTALAGFRTLRRGRHRRVSHRRGVGNYFYGSLRQLAWGRDFWAAILEGTPTRVLNQESVFEHWRWYSERIPHPPLSRELAGLSWAALRTFLDPLTAYRGAVMLLFGALVASVGAYTAWRAGSIAAGVAAGLAVPAIPALFAHGHLAHTDLVLATFWFGSVASLDVAIRRGAPGWFLASGLLLGAAMATKFSGLLLVPVLAIWLLAHRAGFAAYLALGLTAVLVFVAVNPVIWVNPVQGLDDYIQAGLHRADMAETRIATEYFGRIYEFRPPWHYPFVWTLIVLPLPLLIALGIGLFAPRSGALRGLALVNMVVMYGALALPSAPMHDGIRLLLPVFAFYCVLVGTGAVAVGEWMTRLGERVVPAVAARRDLIVALAVVAFLALPLFRTAEYHPHQLSYFNALIGGVEGAEKRGLEVANLKEVLNRSALEDLAEIIPATAVIDPGFFIEEICFYQAVQWAPEGWRAETPLTRRDGATDIALTCEGPQSFMTAALGRPPNSPEYVFVLNRKAQWRRLEQALAGFGGPPTYEIAVRGVPLMRVYRTR